MVIAKPLMLQSIEQSARIRATCRAEEMIAGTEISCQKQQIKQHNLFGGDKVNV